MKTYKIILENGTEGIIKSACALCLPLSLRTKGVDYSGNKITLSGKVVSLYEVQL